MSPERPHGEPSREQEIAPYSQTARYPADEPARRAYQATQDTIHDERARCDLSTYRFLLDRVWHVAVLGSPPPEPVDLRLRAILSSGEPVELPREVLGALTARREQARRFGPWVERHERPR